MLAVYSVLLWLPFISPQLLLNPHASHIKYNEHTFWVYDNGTNDSLETNVRNGYAQNLAMLDYFMFANMTQILP